MIKNFITVSLVAATLVFSGCGGSNEGEDALATQQLLDNGQFAQVIARVEPRANTVDDYITLGAAYMGKAGFSLASIIGIVATSATGNGGNEFSTFVDDVSQRSSTSALSDLDIAIAYYQKVLKNRCLDKSVVLGSAESDLCLYVGLASVSSTAVAISYITDNVSVLAGNTGTSDDKLTASTCAMGYAFNNTYDTTKCTVSAESNVTFTDSNRTYGDINITVNSKSFEYLLTQTTPRSTAVTKGKCTLESFTTRVDDTNATGYHVCPLNESNDVNVADITTDSVLVDTLNNGLDSIAASTSADVQSDIDSFKQEILIANNRSINDANTTITTADLIQYFNSNNQ